MGTLGGMRLRNVNELIGKTIKNREKYWLDSKSEIVHFINSLENKLEVRIDRVTGLIFDKEVYDSNFEKDGKFGILTNEIVSIKLNNDFLEVSQIYFDDRQVIFREDTSKRLRRIRLMTIREVHLGNKVFSFNK